MKIRNGFVSNSSSSSFVVVFPREPKSAEDVKNMLFDEKQIFYDKWPVTQVAETIWFDICDQNKNDFEVIKEEFSYGNFDCDDAPDYNDFRDKDDWQTNWEAYEIANEIYAKKKMKEFFNLRKLKLQKINNEPIEDISLYVFEYSDNDSDYYSALEHGDLFKKLKHVRISKH